MDSLSSPNYSAAWSEFCQNTFSETNVSIIKLKNPSCPSFKTRVGLRRIKRNLLSMLNQMWNNCGFSPQDNRNQRYFLITNLYLNFQIFSCPIRYSDQEFFSYRSDLIHFEFLIHIVGSKHNYFKIKFLIRTEIDLASSLIYSYTFALSSMNVLTLIAIIICVSLSKIPFIGMISVKNGFSLLI